MEHPEAKALMEVTPYFLLLRLLEEAEVDEGHLTQVAQVALVEGAEEQGREAREHQGKETLVGVPIQRLAVQGQLAAT